MTGGVPDFWSALEYGDCVDNAKAAICAIREEVRFKLPRMGPDTGKADAP
jgi:hypothetical protein